LIYAAKPQRGGRNIQANTNNPPQDPPPVNEIPLLPTEVFIPIENTAPPVPEIDKEPFVFSTVVPTVVPEIVKVSWFRGLLTKIRNVFRRKQ